MSVTDPEDLYTLDEAKAVLGRQECEMDSQGGPLTAAWPFAMSYGRPPERKVSPLGHQLRMVFVNGKLDHYSCWRCPAIFVELSQDVVP